MKKYFLIVALFALNCATTQQKPQQLPEKEKGEVVEISKAELERLIEICEEYVGVAEKKQIEYTVLKDEKDDKVVIVTLNFGKELKYVNPIKYAFKITYQAEIESITDTKGGFVVRFKPGTTSYSWRAFFHGALSTLGAIGVIAIIVIL